MSDFPSRGAPERYLGDGVYASFDGYQIWLHTQRESGWHEIALESEVLESLAMYVELLKERARAENKEKK